MLEVIKPGLETSIQDWPGRQGYLKCGFPWSGPMDHWSFRLANVLVGNAPGAEYSSVRAVAMSSSVKSGPSVAAAVKGPVSFAVRNAGC